MNSPHYRNEPGIKPVPTPTSLNIIAVGSENSDKPTAYIECDGEADLHAVLKLMPSQAFMSQYGQFFLLKRTNAPGAERPPISRKIRVFRVQLPNTEVELLGGTEYLIEGDKLQLIYKKQGYLPHTTNQLSLNIASPYFDIVDDAIVKVKAYNAESMGWRYVRKYELDVEDNVTHKPVDRWQWQSGNDSPSQPPVLLAEGSHEVSFCAPGYKKATYRIDTSQSINHAIALEPRERVEKMSFSDVFGRYKETLTVVGRLQSPFFHRFRRNHVYVSRSHPLLIVVLAALLAGGAGFYVGHLLWPIEKPVEKQEVKIPKEEVAKESGVPNKVESPSSDKPEVTEETKEKADLAYLNNNTIWVRDSLQSRRYLFLYDSILPKNVKWSVHNDYYEEITLKEWREFVKSYHKKDKTEFTDKAKIIKDMQRKGYVDWRQVDIETRRWGKGELMDKLENG